MSLGTSLAQAPSVVFLLVLSNENLTLSKLVYKMRTIPGQPWAPTRSFLFLPAIFTLSPQNPHSYVWGQHPGWWLSSLSPFCVLGPRGQTDGHAVPRPPGARTRVHGCAHTDGGSSQQKQPAPWNPAVLGRVRMMEHLSRKVRLQVFGGNEVNAS